MAERPPWPGEARRGSISLCTAAHVLAFADTDDGMTPKFAVDTTTGSSRQQARR
jgi:hypothetical protein